MHQRAFALMAIGVPLLGCSALPQYALDHRILPADLSARIQCELRFAAKLHSRANFDLKNYSAGYTIAVKVETETNPNIKFDWTIPVGTPQSLSVGANAGITDNIMRDGSLGFEAFKISKLNDQSCPEYLKNAYERDVEFAELTYGSFGLIDWIGRMSKAVRPDAISAPNKADYTLRFLLTANAGVTPTYKIVNLSTVGGLPLKRINTHTLTVVLAKNKDDPPPLKVCVVNMGVPCEPKAIEPLTQPDLLPSEKDKQRRKEPPRPRPTGVDPNTRQQIEQQLDFLRLRDILRQ